MASNVVIIYNTATMLLTPAAAMRRVVNCDTDSQVTAPNGPCKLQAGESYALMPTATYLLQSSPDGILAWLLNFLGL